MWSGLYCDLTGFSANAARSDRQAGELDLEMVRIIPETVVVRDQSYQPTSWARQQARGGVLR
jgi:hypothetical protein